MFLILIDKDGKRITSLCVGIHGDSMEKLKEVAQQYNPTEMIEGDAKLQAIACGNVLYKNGKFIETPPYTPSIEERKDKIRAEYAIKLERLIKAKHATELMGGDITEISKAYKKLIKEQKQALDDVK